LQQVDPPKRTYPFCCKRWFPATFACKANSPDAGVTGPPTVRPLA